MNGDLGVIETRETDGVRLLGKERLDGVDRVNRVDRLLTWRVKSLKDWKEGYKMVKS